MTRDEAYALMLQHTPSLSLQRHMLNVETAMRWYARHFGENEEVYAITGLLHDFDYEQHPEYDVQAKTGHPFWGVAYLQANTDVPQDVLTAILGHATYSGVPRETLLAKTLFAVDELTGLVQAAALIRPDKDVRMIELSSLKKKFKTKNFAAGVNRDEVEQGARELGVDLDTHMGNVLKAMQEAAGESQAS
ncbi:HD domain-containing protein [Deinococcus yavapaiensis]|uniref:HD domain-containing protein n=1 Tax=Deinococcus yavapaiensis KR-236 TaxID=694435 RepID=A0A318S1W3_9DEIO|nr:HD domain-containing protein [Deinococcus yavapaiensis]PYE51916.1 hypothetical protein DES52_114117 [Deinococcus yavapaiensis KR-236]